MIDGMTVDSCWRVMHLKQYSENHGGNMHGTFGTLTEFMAPETVSVFRFQGDRQGKDGLFHFSAIMEKSCLGDIRIYINDEGEEHVFKFFRELDVEGGAADVTVTAVIAGINPRARA